MLNDKHLFNQPISGSILQLKETLTTREEGMNDEQLKLLACVARFIT